jgi:hypothetical protein
VFQSRSGVIENGDLILVAAEAPGFYERGGRSAGGVIELAVVVSRR